MITPLLFRTLNMPARKYIHGSSSYIFIVFHEVYIRVFEEEIDKRLWKYFIVATKNLFLSNFGV